MCPHCQQNAPLIYRGLQAYCTACGRPRAVLSGSSLQMAGKPAQVGGAVVKTLGYVALAGGTFVALLAGLIFSLVSATAGLTVGIIFAIMTLLVSIPMLRGGKKLENTGEAERDKQRIQAVFALAANRGGVLRASDVSASLQMPVEGADAFLTELAKKRADEIDIDVSDAGEIVYKFPRLFFVGPSGWKVPGVGAGAAEPERVRVAPAPAATEPAEAPAPRRVPSVNPLPVNAPIQHEVIDAEFEEIDDAPRRARTVGSS